MTDINRMSLPERLHAMELLWRSLSSAPDQVESPSWHAEVLADRLARAESGQARFFSIEETRARLRQR